MRMNRKTFLIFSRTHLDRHLNEIKRKESNSLACEEALCDESVDNTSWNGDASDGSQ